MLIIDCTGKYTLHTHPVVVNALTCRKNGVKIIQELFPKALIVPYATPGVDLANYIILSHSMQL